MNIQFCQYKENSMFSIENYEIFKVVNVAALLMGIAFGVIAQKTQFCFNGAIKDYLLVSSTKRGSSVVTAMITVIIATHLLTLFYDIDLSETVWLREEINYFTIILGGSLFGMGMMIADGCSSRHLVKFSQGDINSIVTLIFIAIFAYASTKGVLNSLVYTLSTNETLVNLSTYIENGQTNIYIVLSFLFLVWFYLTKSFKRISSLKDGIFIGLIIAFGWYLTGVYGAESLELDSRYVPFTSVTFVGPISKTLDFFTHYKTSELNFGISMILGVLIGAFTMSKINKQYSLGCASNVKVNKLKNSMVGGALMGVGGVLSVGCTVGQGLTGFSTLAFASLLAIFSIFISGSLMGLYLKKQNKLPMCFIFEWEDEKKK